MKEVVCIVCPKGCRLEVEDGQVSGAGCVRGEVYGVKEVNSPTRVLTSTVRISGAGLERVPVKTSSDIPKHLIPEAMCLLDGLELQAPVKTGDVVVADICGTGVAWVATRTLRKGNAT